VGALLAALVLFVITWGPWMLPQRETLPQPSDAWIYDTSPGWLARTVHNAGALPLRMLFEPRQATIHIAVMGAVLYVIPLFFLRRRPDLLFWVLWLLCIAGGLLILDLARSTKHLFHIRYSMVAGPAVYALLATLLRDFGRNKWAAHVLPAVASIGCLIHLPAAFEEPQPNYRAYAAFLDEHFKRGEVVVVFAPRHNWHGAALYLCASHESRTYPWPLVMLQEHPSPELMEQLRRAAGVWLLVGSTRPTPGEIFPGAQTREFSFVPHVGMCWHVSFAAPTTKSDRP
jgi:hypothetical protein